MENQEIERLLRENNRLIEENNILLKKMRRSAIIGSIFKLIWVALLVFGPLFLYWYFIQPMVSTLPFVSGGVTDQNVFNQLQELQNLLQNLPQ